MTGGNIGAMMARRATKKFGTKNNYSEMLVKTNHLPTLWPTLGDIDRKHLHRLARRHIRDPAARTLNTRMVDRTRHRAERRR